MYCVVCHESMTQGERENAAKFLEYTTIKPFTFRQGKFNCFYCYETFVGIGLVLEHTDLTHTPVSVQFKNRLKHLRGPIKVDISELRCRICGPGFEEFEDLKYHLEENHDVNFAEDGNGLMYYYLNTTNNILKCHKCDKEFPSFYKLHCHMNYHDGVICETCDQEFGSSVKLQSHKLTHLKEHKCDRCDFVCGSKIKLRYHILRNHEYTEKFKHLKCGHCPEKFKEHYQKMAHLEEAHGISFVFECATCNISFKSRRLLSQDTNKYHLQNIKCQLCDRCFINTTLLTYHMRSHTGERNLVCAICQKAFMHENKLRVHIKTVHSLSFICFKCGLGFSSKDDLIEHKEQVHF